MTDSPSTPSFDVLVVGSDVAALVAALDCARIGLRVVVFATPASAHRPSVFSHREGIVASLLTELEMAFTVRETGSASAEASQGSILGIPANPFSVRVRDTIGWRGAWRVYLDRIMPLLTIGAEPNLGRLVRRRLGKTAVTGLVNPAVRELYGYGAEELAVAAVIPGLNQAMTRAGALTTGVIELIVADPRVAQTVEVAGGIQQIEDVLRERLAFFSARIIDVTDVRLNVTAAGTIGAAEDMMVLAQAVLLNPDTVSGNVPNDLLSEVGVTARHPGLESAVPASRAASAALRRVLLSNPRRLPLGPLDHEG